jgi:acetyl esterase/lipase
MPVNTLTVATAVTPTVIETAILHYLKRRPLRQKPTAHISYHEGLELIRRFLYYASFHTVEELQAFTSQWVPVPHWVHVEEVEIVSRQLLQSADLIQAQLGPKGIEQVGGKTWWQWRLHSAPLKAEWVEMRKDYDARNKAGGQKSHRIMLYVHGGAYYFGSVDEHRYQMQRHARKLKARVLAPRYRLAPQFPFPCGLQDCELYALASRFQS